MQFSWWTFIIQAANFLVLVWLLNRLLFRPVNDIIEKRRRASQKAEEDAERARAEADAEKRRYQDELAAIDHEQHKAIATAHTQIETDRQAILEEARTKAEHEINEARKAIALERREAVEASREEITSLAVAVARKLLSDVVGEIPNNVALARLEKELKALSPRERGLLEREISKSGGAIEVVTASTLSADEHEVWRVRLEQAFKRPVELTFKCDPDLMSGAVLRLPHTSVRASLSDRLAAAKDALLRGHVVNDK